MAQAPAVAAEEAVEAAPKSKKKLIIGIAAALIVAAIAGGVAYFLLKHKAELPKTGIHKEEVVMKEESEKAPVFIALETFTVNLQPDPDEQYLQVEMTMQVPDEKEVENIKLHMPEVRNRVLLLLSSKKASQLKSPEGKNELMNELTQEIKRPFAGSHNSQHLSGIFFTAFVIQ